MILTMPDFFNEIMKITAGVAPQPPSVAVERVVKRSKDRVSKLYERPVNWLHFIKGTTRRI